MVDARCKREAHHSQCRTVLRTGGLDYDAGSENKTEAGGPVLLTAQPAGSKGAMAINNSHAAWVEQFETLGASEPIVLRPKCPR